MNWIEITDPDAPDGGAPGWDVHLHANRPDETVADWIASANPVGEIETSPLFWIKPLHGETCPAKSCVLCSTNATDVAQFAHSWRENVASELLYFDVEWDPTITL